MYPLAARRQIGAFGAGGGGAPAPALSDLFTDTVAAGSVNNTAATPGPGTRVASDAGSTLSVGTGKLRAVGTATAGVPRYYLNAVTRAFGKMMVGKANAVDSGAYAYLGFNNLTNASPTWAAFSILASIVYDGNTQTVVSTALTNNVEYSLAFRLRASGLLLFIKGGTEYPQWTLLWAGNLNNTATLYPGAGARGNGLNQVWDSIRVFDTSPTITPLASDAFAGSGVLGNTGGGGCEEAGGDGKAWTDMAGVWGKGSGVASCSSLSSGIGIATADAGSTNVWVEAAVTRTAGNAGIVVRYADANNYIYALHNGTNAQLIKVVAGTPTTLINAAATYSAGARLIVSAHANKFRLYYNTTLVGTEQTIADASLQTGTAHGLYTSDTGNTFDNFVVFARGLGGEYNFDPYMEST